MNRSGAAPVRNGRPDPEPVVGDHRMRSGALRPETLMDLQIHIDHLTRTAERCRMGLLQIRGGALSPEAYRELLEEQRSAQQAWENKNRQYFCPGD